MDALSSGLMTIFNGILNLLGHIVSPVGAALTLMILSLTWLCVIQIEDMDRLGTKPNVDRH